MSDRLLSEGKAADASVASQVLRLESGVQKFTQRVAISPFSLSRKIRLGRQDRSSLSKGFGHSCFRGVAPSTGPPMIYAQS